MIDLRRKRSVTTDITRLIDKALVIEESFQPGREYIGGSVIGKFCERQIQYMVTHTPVDPGKEFDGRLLRVFQRGHMMEAAAIEWLKKAGFAMIEGKQDGGQFGFRSNGGLFRGHCDSIIIAGPYNHGPFPRLWECKALEQKYFNALKKKGLREENETYFGQCQIYMKKFKLTRNPALFTAVNPNRMELYFEDIPYDPGHAQYMEERVERIIRACKMGELLPRAIQDKDFFKCKMCSWREQCHG